MVSQRKVHRSWLVSTLVLSHVSLSKKHKKIGRKEMAVFFVWFLIQLILEILTVTFVIPPSAGSIYQVRHTFHLVKGRYTQLPIVRYLRHFMWVPLLLL
jgi:hypothetical protein